MWTEHGKQRQGQKTEKGQKEEEDDRVNMVNVTELPGLHLCISLK